ncbi:MAG: DUF4142 domain-containing protein [Flavobacteriales bacterium]|nr:DUF4142 domain-containing protein [Flavobacteriales bacterium]
MKNYKTALFQVALIISAVMGMSACMDNKPEDTKEVAEERNEEKFDTNKSEKDAQFLVNAAEINREEISLGKLAQQKGVMNHVKELGKMMETEHGKSLVDLTALAKAKNISLPAAQTENEREAYKKLNDKTGNDFSKAYSNMMVDRHKEAIRLFEKASTDGTDPEIRAWATSMLPALRTHLEHSEMCQMECDKM